MNQLSIDRATTCTARYLASRFFIPIKDLTYADRVTLPVYLRFQAIADRFIDVQRTSKPHS
jgi:hypothetical protein